MKNISLRIFIIILITTFFNSCHSSSKIHLKKVKHNLSERILNKPYQIAYKTQLLEFVLDSNFNANDIDMLFDYYRTKITKRQTIMTFYYENNVIFKHKFYGIRFNEDLWEEFDKFGIAYFYLNFDGESFIHYVNKNCDCDMCKGYWHWTFD